MTALEVSATFGFYKLCPKQTEAVSAFVCRHGVSVSPPNKGTRSAENTYEYELGHARRGNRSGICYCACR